MPKTKKINPATGEIVDLTAEEIKQLEYEPGDAVWWVRLEKNAIDWEAIYSWVMDPVGQSPPLHIEDMVGHKDDVVRIAWLEDNIYGRDLYISNFAFEYPVPPVNAALTEQSDESTIVSGVCALGDSGVASLGNDGTAWIISRGEGTSIPALRRVIPGEGVETVFRLNDRAEALYQSTYDDITFAFVAGINAERCHVLLHYASTDLYRPMAVSTASGETHIILGDVWWPCDVSFFGAKEVAIPWPAGRTHFSEEEWVSHNDVLIIAGEYFPYLSLVASGKKVESAEFARTGIVSFLFEDTDRWSPGDTEHSLPQYSDHFEVRIADSDYDENLELTTAFQSPNGDVGVVYKITSYGIEQWCLQQSVDGMSWDMPRPLSGINPAQLVSMKLASVHSSPTDSDHLIRIEKSRFYPSVDPSFSLTRLSPAAHYFGGKAAPDNMLEITDLIQGGTISIREKGTISLTLQMTDQLMSFLGTNDADTWSAEGRKGMILRFAAGYSYDHRAKYLPNRRFYINTFTGDVTGMATIRQPGGKWTVRLDASDFIGRFSRRMEITRELTGISAGSDDFSDPLNLDTGYGGMSHIAVVEGSMTTPYDEETDSYYLATSEKLNGWAAGLSTHLANEINFQMSCMFEHTGAPLYDERILMLGRATQVGYALVVLVNPFERTIMLGYRDGEQELDEDGEESGVWINHEITTVTVPDTLWDRRFLMIWDCRYGRHRVWYYPQRHLDAWEESYGPVPGIPQMYEDSGSWSTSQYLVLEYRTRTHRYPGSVGIGGRAQYEEED